MKRTNHLALLLCALLCACRASAEATVESPALVHDLQLESIRTDRQEGCLHVQFDLRNRRATRLPLEWTLTWLDAGGAVLDLPPTWTPAVLGASGFETLALTAPTPLAAGFRLNVRGHAAPVE